MKLSYHQSLMLRISGFDPRDGQGFGVHLSTPANWRTARSLVSRGLGWIEGGQPNGSELPGLFFANTDGAEVHHPDEVAAWRIRKRV